MYQQTLSNWYGVNAGQEFTEARVQNLIQELQEVTPARVREHRTWLRHNMHKWWQGRWVAPAPVYPQGVAQHRSAPEVMMWTNEDSEQVLRQPGLSRDMVGTAAHQKVYRPEGKLLEPEEDSHTLGAHDTQLIDLTTEEPALLEELGSEKTTREDLPSRHNEYGSG